MKKLNSNPPLEESPNIFYIFKTITRHGITAQQWSWLVEYIFQFGEVSGLPIIQKRTICQRKKLCFFSFFSGICYTLMKGKNIWFEYDNFNFLFPWNMANLGKFFAKQIMCTSHNPLFIVIKWPNFATRKTLVF